MGLELFKIGFYSRFLPKNVHLFIYLYHLTLVQSGVVFPLVLNFDLVSIRHRDDALMASTNVCRSCTSSMYCVH